MAAIVSTRIARLQGVSPRTVSGIDQSGVVITLSNSAVALPANAAGAVTSYASATTTISVTHGGVDQSASWTISKADGAGVASTLSGRVITVTSLTVDAAQVTITATRIGYATQMRTFNLTRAKAGTNGTNGANGTNGTNGATGPRGPATLAYSTTATAWTDALAASALSISGYGAPIERDLVTLYNTTAGFSDTRLYTDSAWTAIAAYINGSMVVSGTFSADKITTGTLTGVVIRTAASGTRVIANEAASNTLRVYLGTTKVVELGGSGSVWSKSITPGQASIYGESTSTGAAIYGTTSSDGGAGVIAETTAGGSPAMMARVPINPVSHVPAPGAGPALQARGNVIPEYDAAYSLGTFGVRWNSIYAKDVYGNLTGDCYGDASYGKAWGASNISTSATFINASTGHAWTSSTPSRFIEVTIGGTPYLIPLHGKSA